MSRTIDYAHASLLIGIENTAKSIRALAPYRELPPELPPAANEGLLTALRSLNKALTAMQAAEEAVMAWKRSKGEVE